MAFIQLHRDRLQHNYNYLSELFACRSTDWAIVSKLLCGNELYLREIISLGIKELCDSRLSNLRRIKALDPTIQTVYIKPPAKRIIPKIVQFADVSFNSESRTVELLSREAVRQKKIHKITIMIEMGDLREGIMADSLHSFYSKVVNLPNIEIVAIGTNLNCLHGVMPSQEKLVELAAYKAFLERTYGITIPWITGGTSVVVPLLLSGEVPAEINHFRIGEALFFGKNLVTSGTIEGMKANVFRLYCEIIEITQKPRMPFGELGTNPSGKVADYDSDLVGIQSYRAILDVGLLDVSPQFLLPDDVSIELIDASSDMLVIDLGDNSHHYSVGDLVPFRLEYMGALGVLSSDYIRKEIV